MRLAQLHVPRLRAAASTTQTRVGRRRSERVDALPRIAEAGLVKVGVIAIDGTKVHPNACQHAAHDYEQLAREILAEGRRRSP